jgi:hypothetical protein
MHTKHTRKKNGVLQEGKQGNASREESRLGDLYKKITRQATHIQQ